MCGEVLIWDVEAPPNRHAVLGAVESHPDLMLTGHQDNAEFALAMCPLEPFVLSGGAAKGLEYMTRPIRLLYFLLFFGVFAAKCHWVLCRIIFMLFSGVFAAKGLELFSAWLQAQPLFNERNKFSQMADPMLQGQYPARGLYQALAVAAMCVHEQPTMRPLIADVVTALT